MSVSILTPIIFWLRVIKHFISLIIDITQHINIFSPFEYSINIAIVFNDIGDALSYIDIDNLVLR